VPALIYVKSGCPFCQAKRDELRARGVECREIDVGARPEVIPELLKLTRGKRIVPVIVESGRIEIAPGGGTTF
jgi:glutaredoxin 3